MKKDTVLASPDEDDKSDSGKNNYEIPSVHSVDWKSSSTGIPLLPSEILGITSGSAILLGGTISALSGQVNEIRQTLSSSDSLITPSLSEDNIKALQENNKKMASQLLKMEKEITELKSVKTTVENVNKFLENTASFLTDLLSANGRLNGMQGEMDSIKSRIGTIETNKDRRNTANLSKIGIAIAIISLISSVLLGILIK